MPRDFGKLSFSLYSDIEQMSMFEAHYENGEWQKGSIIPYHHLELSPAANILNYGQGIFEGMKAYRSTKNPENVLLFRPMENARRFRTSCQQMAIPEVLEEVFMDAVFDVVKANADFVPASDDGSHSLYLRPLCIATEPMLGVRAANQYTFLIYASPVGPYFSNVGIVRLAVTDAHRAAPHGTGAAKAVCNYAGSMRPGAEAKKAGYDGVLFLDAANNRYIEEAGAANVFVLMDDGRLLTPKLGSILPGITRDSIIQVARKQFGLEVVETDIDIKDVCEHGIEFFLTGTGAIITSVSEIAWRGTEYNLNKNDYQLAKRTYDLLIGMQLQRHPDPYGWIVSI